METYISHGLGKINLILGILLILRIVLRGKSDVIYKVNVFLRKNHKKLGAAIIICGLIHGIFSFESSLTFQTGVFCWITTVLLGLSVALRKKLKDKWIVLHRILSVFFVISLVLHLVY